MPFYGSTVLCLDDEHVRDILPQIKRRVISYGINSHADYQARNIVGSGPSSVYELYYRGGLLGSITLNVPGLFNVYNSMASVAVARELEMRFESIQEGLLSFGGVGRRLETKGKVNGITVVDDYGHHPTEVRATLAAARQVWKDRLVVVFQPHRYTRTKALFNEFITCFSDADTLILTDIYAASEPPIEGVSSKSLYESILRAGHPDVHYIPAFEDIVAKLVEIVRPTDTVITQGAGTVYKIGEKFLKAMED